MNYMQFVFYEEIARKNKFFIAIFTHFDIKLHVNKINTDCSASAENNLSKIDI